jgi:hypothetical protein
LSFAAPILIPQLRQRVRFQSCKKWGPPANQYAEHLGQRASITQPNVIATMTRRNNVGRTDIPGHPSETMLTHTVSMPIGHTIQKRANRFRLTVAHAAG